MNEWKIHKMKWNTNLSDGNMTNQIKYRYKERMDEQIYDEWDNK